MIINKSDIVASLSDELKSYTSSDIDYSIKKILSLMSKSLYSGEKLKSVVSVHFHFTTITLGLQGIQKQVI